MESREGRECIYRAGNMQDMTMARGELQVLDTLAVVFSAGCLTGCEHVVFEKYWPR